MRGEFMDNWWWAITIVVVLGAGLYEAYNRGSWMIASLVIVWAIAVGRAMQLERENDRLRDQLEEAE
jgi:uncharacterized membrane protein